MGPIGLTPALRASSVEWRDDSRQWTGKGVEGKLLSWNLRHYPGICLENWEKPRKTCPNIGILTDIPTREIPQNKQKIWNVFNKILNKLEPGIWEIAVSCKRNVPSHKKKFRYPRQMDMTNICHLWILATSWARCNLYKHTYWPLMRFLPAVSKCDTSQRNRQRFFNMSRIFATTHLYNLVVWQIFFVAFFRLAQLTGLCLLTDSPTTALSSSRKKNESKPEHKDFLCPEVKTKKIMMT